MGMIRRSLILNTIARLTRWTGVTGGATCFRNHLLGPYLCAVNYHWTAEVHRERFERHLVYFKSAFECVDQAGLTQFLRHGAVPTRPLLIVSFDDGYRNNFDVATPLLEKHGIPGWFFVVARACNPEPTVVGGPLNTRFCMDWDQLCDLQARGHVVGCHTYHHRNVGTIAHDELKREIVEAKSVLEQRLAEPINAFCFPYGTSACFSEQSLELIRQHYSFAFHNFPGHVRPFHSPLSIGRMPCEPHWHLDVIRFRLSGLIDMRYKGSLSRYDTMLKRLTSSSELPGLS